MSKKGVTLEGGDELARQLKKLDGGVKKVLEDATLTGAEIWRSVADANAPVPEIEKETVEKSADRVAVDVGPNEEHWYLQFFETGTGAHDISPNQAAALLVGGDTFAANVFHPGMAAEPFLRPAADENETQAEEALGEVLKEAIDRVTT